VVGIGTAPPRAGPRRGDIHVIAFPDVGDHVIRGPHPAVVVSTDRLNRPVGTVLVCPLTSKISHDPTDYLPPYLVPITRKASGLDRDGYAKVDQVLTRPAATLGARIGRVNPETMATVDQALRFVLDL
jgi:mRNA-degrading endonuclease toxin of MazEF toxin-antitoxin module